ncbi:MAG: c-type cytochrome [Anaerolineaceae bacterium]|jgi:mono/diheme cytochrome c family protein|nr:c-type cytochrome [Anaerolineaceae bacterium]
MIKKLILVLGALVTPLIIGLFFTYDVIKIDWVSLMEIQSSYRPMEDPLPLPARSIPIQGAAYIPELGVPANPVFANEDSVKRGKDYYDTSCALCHGDTGEGNGGFSGFLRDFPPVSLVDANRSALSDGAIFVTITEGVPGKMPNLKENLPSPEMRWDVVNYVRFLQDQANP